VVLDGREQSTLDNRPPPGTRCGAPNPRRITDNAEVTLRRLAAFYVDWLFIIGYAALLLPFGIPLYHWVHGLPTWALNAGTFAILVVPATVWLAGWERTGRRATPGKRVMRLRVAPVSGGSSGWWRSLARNGLKLALPWELGHTGLYAIVSGSDAVGLVCAILGNGLLLVYLGYAAVSGRTPYDRLTGTTVERVSPA
jgi:uncharacterized RDD family membrane protein YckC